MSTPVRFGSLVLCFPQWQNLQGGLGNMAGASLKLIEDSDPNVYLRNGSKGGPERMGSLKTSCKALFASNPNAQKLLDDVRPNEGTSQGDFFTRNKAALLQAFASSQSTPGNGRTPSLIFEANA